MAIGRVRPRVLGALALLWVCWGSSLPAMRVLVATLPPLLVTGGIFFGAGVLLLAGRPAAVRELSGRRVLTASGIGGCLLGAQGLVAVAEQHVYAGTAALTVAAVPLWVAVLRAGLGDRPTRAGVVRVLVGFAGVAVVAFGGAGSFGWSPWTLLVLAAAVGWAAGTVWAARATDLPAPYTTTVVQLLAGGLALLAAGVVAGETGELDSAAVAPASWVAAGYLLLVDSLAGFWLYSWLLRAAPVGLVSTYAYAVPVVAYTVGVLVLDEPFEPVLLAGAAAVVVSVGAETRAAGRVGG